MERKDKEIWSVCTNVIFSVRPALVTHSNIALWPKPKGKFPLPCSTMSSYYLSLTNINLLNYYIHCLAPPTRMEASWRPELKVCFVRFPSAWNKIWSVAVQRTFFEDEWNNSLEFSSSFPLKITSLHLYICNYQWGIALLLTEEASSKLVVTSKTPCS